MKSRSSDISLLDQTKIKKMTHALARTSVLNFLRQPDQTQVVQPQTNRVETRKPSKVSER